MIFKKLSVSRLKYFFLSFSFLLVVVSVYSIFRWGFKTSIDFAGGTVWEISWQQAPEQSAIKTVFTDQQIDLLSLSTTSDSHFFLKFPNINPDQKDTLTLALTDLGDDFAEFRFETLSPTLGRELLKKTGLAVAFAIVFLLLFITTRFKDFTFGLVAILAMLHDSLILIGSFSLFGHFFGAEVDALFVTAVLTTLSASVHDTIVTFDRIRELKSKSLTLSWSSLADSAVRETLVRSINNSMTIIFMLLALVVLGPLATRWFAVALLTGAILGTYSSLGVAIPLFLVFKEKKQK